MFHLTAILSLLSNGHFTHLLFLLPSRSVLQPMNDFPFRQPDNLDDIIAIAIEAEFPPDRSKLPNDRSLNDRESNRMMELFLASRALEEPLEVRTLFFRIAVLLRP